MPVSEAYGVAVENSMYYAEASALSQDGVHKLFDKAVSMRAKKTKYFVLS